MPIDSNSTRTENGWNSEGKSGRASFFRHRQNTGSIRDPPEAARPLGISRDALSHPTRDEEGVIQCAGCPPGCTNRPPRKIPPPTHDLVDTGGRIQHERVYRAPRDRPACRPGAYWRADDAQPHQRRRFPAERPAKKLDNTRLVAQTPWPGASPDCRNHGVSKSRAETP